MRKNFVTALIITTTAVGCAHSAPKVQFDGNWAADPAKDRKMREELELKQVTLLDGDAPEGIDVFLGKIPAGLKLEAGVLSPEEGSGYLILGKATMEASAGSQFGFPEYEQGWRKGLCYWQAPLTWVTLSIWAAVPVNYPCGVNALRSKEDVLKATKNLVKELGGDFFVGDYLWATEEDAAGVTGFIIKKIVPEQQVVPAETKI